MVAGLLKQKGQKDGDHIKVYDQKVTVGTSEHS